MTPLTSSIGAIYLITDGRHLKLGWTAGSVEARLNQLQTGNATELSVLASVAADNPIDEALILGHLHDLGLHVRGEWFLMHDQLVASFKRNSRADGVLRDLDLQRPEKADEGTLSTVRRNATASRQNRPRAFSWKMSFKPGKHFSEGTRRLWLVQIGDSMSQREMARKWFGGQQSLVSKVLWGRRKPSLELAIKLERTLGIAASLWAEPPTEPFMPPPMEQAYADLGFPTPQPEPAE